MRFRQINLRKLWLSLLLLVGATAIAIPGIQEVMVGNVAKVGDTEYATIEEAVEAWGPGKTLTLLADVTTTSTVTVEVNATKSTQNWTLDLGDHTWTASGCNAFQLYAAGGTVMNQNYGLKIYANQNGGITASGKYCIECKYDNSTAGYRPRLEIHGGTYNGSNIIYYASLMWNSTNVSNGPSTHIFKSNDGTEPVFNGNFALAKCPLTIYAGYFNGTSFNTYPVTSTANTNLNGGHFKTISAFPSASNNKGIIFGNYKVYVKSDASIDVVNGAPATYEAKATKTLLLSSNQGVNYSDYVYYEKANDALNKYSSGTIEIILSEGVTATQEKSFRSGTLTIDATAEGSAYTGNITLTSTSAKFVIKFPEGKGHYGVTASTGQLHVEETVADGVVTRTYSVKNVSDPEAKVGETSYGTVYDAFYAIDGTTDNKTIVLQKDVTNAGIVTNGTAVNAAGKTVATFDLNGKSIGIGSVAAGNNADYTLTIIDSSQDKTGTVTNSDASLFILALTGINDYSGSYTLKIQAGTWQFDPSNVVINGETHNLVDEGYVARDNGNGTWTVVETTRVAKIGTTKYSTLQSAVDAAQQMGGEVTVNIIDDISGETVTIKEVANFKLTIDGKKDASSNYTVDARIVVDGLRGNGGSNTNGASVTLQNIDFVRGDYLTAQNKAVIEPCHYPHHLTIQDCKYTGQDTDASRDCWFLDTSDAPLYNANIKNVTVAHSRLIQGSLGMDVVFENIIATNDVKCGFNLKTEGTVLIKDCQVTTAKYAFRDYKDAYVGTFTLEGNTFTSTSEESDEGAIVNRGGAVGTGHINVVSGTYTGHLRVLNNKEGVLAISGGYFSEEFPQSYIAADLVAQGKVCAPATDKEGFYTIGDPHFVAQIGETGYKSLADAVAAVPENGTETTITMIDNETIVGNAGVTIPVGKNIVLDLNGKTVTLSVTESKGSQLITNRGTLTITDGSEGQAGKLTNVADESLAVGSWPTNNYVTNVITNSGTLNIEAGNIISTANGSICYAVDNNSTSYDAILNIKGGYLTSVGTVVRQFCNSTTKQNVINMTGGVVTTNGSAAIWTQLPGSSATSKKLATLNISGGEITASSYAWYDYSYGDSFEAVEYNISGGKFTGSLYSYALRDGIISGFISGGLFSPAPSSSYIKPAGYMFGPSEEVEGYYTLVPAEVDYSWTENGEVIHDYLPFNTPFKKNYLMDGETITLMQDITLTENLTWTVETETATSTLTFGEYKITKGDYSVALNPGETIKTDKRTDIFTSANSDYELVETAVSGGYTYSLLKNAIEPVAPEKPAVNPDFSVKIPTGTYQIKNNATGNYVNIVSKYYAKAEGTESTDYTKIGVGVGYKVADGYRVFSLTGKNPADNSEIEAYNYVAKAYTMAVKLVQEKITGRFSDNFSATTIDELNAFADSVCAIYIDDYAYLTLVPVSTDGTNYQVRAMATVPAIPNTVWTLGNSMIRGHVIDGHTCTDTWDWAKWQVYHYINTHSQMDATLQSMVKANLESIVPGTTYFLTAEEDGTLGYATTLTDATLWTMEPVETVEDGLTPDEYHIQNVGTEKFVNVTDTYYAKVDITEDDLIMEEIPATLINVDFGRSSKDNPNLYRITELSNGDKDVVAYVKKAVNKVKSLAANMTLNGTPLYEAMANKINELLGVQIAPADIKEDVELALDLCGEHYAYLNLVDNGDGTVSVYGDMPKVPALLDHAIKKLNLADDFLTWAKAQIDDYFATSGSNATLISLWNGNKGKIVPGQRYYLTSDNDDTFGFANNNSADAAKWMLTHVEKSFAELIDGVDYDVTLAGKTYKKMTYTRSFSSTQKDKYQRWYIPADYTITEEDAENFEFYKIHMIAASNNEQGDVITDNTKIYLYIEPLSSGTLKANRPYVVKPLKEMTDHVFEMQNVDLLAVDESPRLEVGVSEYLYDFYGTYDHFTYANAHEIFYLNGGSIHPNKSNAKMIPYMWYIKPKKNAINDDYAKVTFEFVEVETPTAITVPDANKSNEIEGYYSVNGIKQDGPQKGLNIVKYKNGQTKKVNIK